MTKPQATSKVNELKYEERLLIAELSVVDSRVDKGCNSGYLLGLHDLSQGRDTMHGIFQTLSYRMYSCEYAKYPSSL
jgi:hypothetical protein